MFHKYEYLHQLYVDFTGLTPYAEEIIEDHECG